MCGAFDFYTYEPLKGYYPLYWYGLFYNADAYVKCETEADSIYSLCAVDKSGKALAVITHYSDDDGKAPETVSIDFGRNGKYEVYMLDETHDGELLETFDELSFTLPVNSCVFIKEV